MIDLYIGTHIETIHTLHYRICIKAVLHFLTVINVIGGKGYIIVKQNYRTTMFAIRVKPIIELHYIRRINLL